LGRTTPRRSRRVCCPEEIEEVGPFGLVELQGARYSFEDVLGDAAGVAPFETRVVLDADGRQHRDLLAAQAGYAPPCAVGGQACLLGSDLGTPRNQELPDVIASVHIPTLRACPVHQ